MKREFTPEQRAAASERMKRLRAEGKMQRKPKDPALQEALAKAPMNMPQVSATPHEVVPSAPAAAPSMTTHIPPNGAAARPVIVVNVDWQTIPMLEGQFAYGILKAEFEKAGRILNARSMERFDGYTCFMCHKHHLGRPGFVDHSFIDPLTGLAKLVECCGELCVINYNKYRIELRLAHNLEVAEAQRR